MRQSIKFLILIAVLLTGCDDVIHPDLESANAIYVVDAFITNKNEPQVIHLTYSQSYFDETLPPGVSGATINIAGSDGTMYNFIPDDNIAGDYVWTPSGTPFGVSGKSYVLTIAVNGQVFTSSTKMGRVPPIDSIAFQKGDRDVPGEKDFYRGQFYAEDPAGVGDTYWIKAYKNDTLLNKPSEINLAYDAAFSKGSSFDGFTFIQPIRSGINPDNTDSNNKSVSPYSPGDSVYVEINSLSEASFDYLTQVVVQTNRPGGFSELFARPLANVPTNIVNTTAGGTSVAGFFNVAAVSGLGKRFKK